jgi:protein required for attachment to host cells
METRVIVADNARARIFVSHDVLNHLVEQEDFIHSEAHLKNQELVGDAAGKSRDPHGSLDPATAPKELEAQNFAKLLAKHLKALHSEQHFDHLILIAPPHFLGLLRKELHKPLDQLVKRTIHKDLTIASVEDIIDYIKSS